MIINFIVNNHLYINIAGDTIIPLLALVVLANRFRYANNMLRFKIVTLALVLIAIMIYRLIGIGLHQNNIGE